MTAHREQLVEALRRLTVGVERLLSDRRDYQPVVTRDGAGITLVYHAAKACLASDPDEDYALETLRTFTALVGRLDDTYLRAPEGQTLYRAYRNARATLVAAANRRNGRGWVSPNDPRRALPSVLGKTLDAQGEREGWIVIAQPDEHGNVFLVVSCRPEISHEQARAMAKDAGLNVNPQGWLLPIRVLLTQARIDRPSHFIPPQVLSTGVISPTHLYRSMQEQYGRPAGTIYDDAGTTRIGWTFKRQQGDENEPNRLYTLVSWVCVLQNGVKPAAVDYYADLGE